MLPYASYCSLSKPTHLRTHKNFVLFYHWYIEFDISHKQNILVIIIPQEFNDRKRRELRNQEKN